MVSGDVENEHFRLKNVPEKIRQKRIAAAFSLGNIRPHRPKALTHRSL
jgi:hypothetical protein